jgi:hypothetical protein
MITIDFSIGNYHDALILEDDHSFTDEEIEAMKQSRYDSWYAIISNPALAEAQVHEEEVEEEEVEEEPTE